MTRKEAREEMIKMWDWLRKNPSRNKNDYINEVDSNADNWNNSCAACEECDYNCKKCFIDWPILRTDSEDIKRCNGDTCMVSFYLYWVQPLNKKEGARLATEILKLALAAKV